MKRGRDGGRRGGDERRGGAERGRDARANDKRGRAEPQRRTDKRERHAAQAKERLAREQASRRASPRRAFPTVRPAPLAPPRPGDWLLTTRPGAEIDLLEELAFLDDKTAAHPAGPSLVAARTLPRRDGRPAELAFARQGFVVDAVTAPDGAPRALVDALARTGAPQPWALDAWVPDADPTNPLQPDADRLRDAVLGMLPLSWANARLPDARAAFGENGLYAQLCRWDAAAAVGVVPARDAPSLAPGGRLRVHVPNAAPSRAAMKLLEAFAWLDRAPEAGEVCVDLGAAPGGWTWALLERGARVYAVDPARLAPSLRGRRGLTHLQADAFHFDPGEPVDWLFSDMAWRPLEAAALLAKWARRGWARLFVANIKLPMRKKAEHVFRIRDILADGGWSSLRARQLYHDRDEVTFAGVRI